MQRQLDAALSQLRRAVKKEAIATTRNVATPQTRRFHRRQVKLAINQVYEVLRRKS